MLVIYWPRAHIMDIIVPQYTNITTKFSTLKLLFFSFYSCLTIERSIVFKTMDRLWTGNVNRFRGCLVPRPDWIKVLYLFGTLGLHRLLTKTLKFKKNLKNFSFHKISKFQNFHKIFKFQNFYKTCSHHVHLCWSLLSQKNQTYEWRKIA